MKMRHPMSGAVYERRDDGLVCVVEVEGRSGVFHPDGRWQEGELRVADPHLLEFVGGRQLARPKASP